MPSGDLFGVGVSGLLSFQRSLTTTGHNISNVNTPGYSRQRVELATRYPTPSGGGFLGNGVKPVTTQRIFDEHAVAQVRLRTTSTEFYDNYVEWASQVDNLVADPDAGLAPVIEQFFDSMQGVADDPTSLPAREVLLADARSMVSRFHTLEQWLADMRRSVNDRVEGLVGEINSFADQIAQMNEEIIVAKGVGGDQPPNDLLDQRDYLIDQLSELVNVTTLDNSDGTKDVFIGSGQSLVLRTQSMSFEAQPDPNDPINMEVAYVDPGTSALVPITSFLTGGKLGGTLAFREDILDPAFNHLGRVAIGLSVTFNNQHYEGMDLNNALGGDFFTDITGVPDVSANIFNAGSADAPTVVIDNQVGVNDVSDLTTADYRLTYLASGDYELENLETGTTTVLAAGLGPTYAIDGMVIDVSTWTAPAVGDEVDIRPTRLGARNMGMQINDPNLIAASHPIRTDASIANLGDGAISEATITDITQPQIASGALNPPYTIRFTAPNQFDIINTTTTAVVAAAVPYTPGAQIDLPPGGPPFAYNVTLTGNPQVGDEFYIDYNTNGFSDNRNARDLADLQITGTLEGGSASYHEAYSKLVVQVGNNTRKAKVNFEAQNALLNQARELRESISGVNLDEEAANMLKFQQSYSAAAQVIATADQVFQTLLAAVAR